MSGLNEFLLRVHIDPGGALAVAVGVAVLVGLAGAVMLWRAHRLLKAVPHLDDRLASLSNSLSLLTDTTEACFRAVSMQMQFMQTGQSAQSAHAAAQPTSRASSFEMTEPGSMAPRGRHRRNAAALAAEDELSDSELALRLRVTGASPAA